MSALLHFIRPLADWYFDGPGWAIATVLACYVGWRVKRLTMLIIVLLWACFGLLLILSRHP